MDDLVELMTPAFIPVGWVLFGIPVVAAATILALCQSPTLRGHAKGYLRLAAVAATLYALGLGLVLIPIAPVGVVGALFCIIGVFLSVMFAVVGSLWAVVVVPTLLYFDRAMVDGGRSPRPTNEPQSGHNEPYRDRQ